MLPLPHSATPDDPVDAITGAWQRERPGMPVGGMQVVTRVWQLAKLFGDTRRRVVAEQGADFATLDLLSTLRRAGPPYQLSTRELARQSMVTAGAISQRLTRAERDGLVERTRSLVGPTVMVTLLDAGHDLVDRLVGQVAATDEDLLISLSAGQRDALDALLRIVLADLNKRYGSSAVSHVGDE
ncbi:MAG: MarR family winged helix-turn-helix transcriptional regulator [Pseudonocardiaceae bacterium]